MTGETAVLSTVKAVATTAPIDEKARFAVPDWATRPPPGSHLDVCKGEQLIQVRGLPFILAVLSPSSSNVFL